MQQTCNCGSNILIDDCCRAIISKQKIALSPEELMRSRYVAYTEINIDYLVKTTHPKTRKHYSPISMEQWAKTSKWIKLEIISTSSNPRKHNEGIVEFKAYYFDSNFEAQIHHEISTFEKIDAQWYYVEGK